MADQPKLNVIKMSDHKPFEDIIREKCGDKYLFGYFCEETDQYFLYVSNPLYDRDLAYLSAMIQRNLDRRMDE